MRYCAHCGTKIPEEPELHYCIICGASIEAGEVSEPGEGLPHEFPAPPFSLEPEFPVREAGCAWEDPGLPFLVRWLRTLRESLFEPTDFFRKIPGRGNLTDALAYLLLNLLIHAAVSLGWFSMHNTVLRFPFFTSHFPDVFVELGRILACSPVGLLFWVFMGSLSIHAILWFLDGTRSGFEATLRGFCYSSGALCFSVIPLIGSTLGLFYWIVLSMIAVKNLHQTNGSRVVAAYLLPIVFVCVLAMVIQASILTWLGGIG